MKPKVLINYAVLCFIWGTTWIILKKSLVDGTPPFFGSGFRFFFGGIVLWGIILYKRDFAKELWKTCPKLKIVDYGFHWKEDPFYKGTIDNTNWFLFKK